MRIRSFKGPNFENNRRAQAMRSSSRRTAAYEAAAVPGAADVRTRAASARCARRTCSASSGSTARTSWSCSQRANLLPAIFFIFSRVGCDAAVQQVRRAGVRLTIARGARRDPRDRRGAHPHPARRGPRGARLLGVARQPRARRRLAPRRTAAGVQGGRRGALPAQAREGRLRDRDARARHQHAGAHRRAREAREVQRRGARRDHLGGVHPAHRSRRTPRHRRRGPRGHPVDRGPRSAGGRRARLAAHLSAQLQLPPDLQHGREPHRPVRPGEGARDPRVVVRAVPGRPRRRRPRPPGARAGGVPRRATRRR